MDWFGVGDFLMAHFVQITNGTVTNGIAISNDVVGVDYPESEPVGQTFIAQHGYEGQWLQTSYNNNFRKQYAGIGFTYDADADVFVAPQPFPSWSLDANYDWQAPIDYPADGKDYLWDETNQVWVESPAI
jgi:hypothetical protein